MQRIHPLHAMAIAVVAFCTGAILFSLFHQSDFPVTFDTEPLSPQAVVQWYGQKEEGFEPITLPYADPEAKAGDAMVYQVLLSEDWQGLYLLFFTLHQTLEVSWGQEVLYSYQYQAVPEFMETNGSLWHMIRVPDRLAGEVLTVEINSPYDLYIGRLDQVYVGTKTALMYYIIHRYGLNFLLTIFVLLWGIGLTGVYFVTRLRLKISPQLLYLGLFTLATGGWLLGESRMLQLFWGNALTNYFLVYVCLGQIGFWLLLFTWEVCGRPRSISFYLLIATNGVFMMGQIVCQFVGLWDFPHGVPVVHGMLMLSAVFGMCQICRERLRRNPQTKGLVFPVIILFAFGSVELATFYRGKLMSNAIYLQVGMALFLLTMGTLQLLKFHRMLNDARKAQYYQHLAYTDFLTGLQNRTSYEKDLDKISQCKHGLEGLCVICFDLNDLKIINDRLGHAAGDDALAALGGYLQHSVGRMGTCYRTGGDEFVCICRRVIPQILSNRLRSLDKSLEKHRSDFPYQLRVAYGYACYDDGRDADIQALLKRADEEMYRRKAAMKKQVKG